MIGTEDELGDVLERLVVSLRQARTPGVSATALSVLRRLHETGSARITDLAVAEGVSQPAMTSLVDRLEQRGWAARSADPSDRRAALVALTTAGREHITGHQAARAALFAARFDLLPEPDRVALAAAIPALRRLAEAPAPADPARTDPRSIRVDA